MRRSGAARAAGLKGCRLAPRSFAANLASQRSAGRIRPCFMPDVDLEEVGGPQPPRRGGPLLLGVASVLRRLQPEQ